MVHNIFFGYRLICKKKRSLTISTKNYNEKPLAIFGPNFFWRWTGCTKCVFNRNPLTIFFISRPFVKFVWRVVYFTFNTAPSPNIFFTVTRLSQGQGHRPSSDHLCRRRDPRPPVLLGSKPRGGRHPPPD